MVKEGREQRAEGKGVSEMVRERGKKGRAAGWRR